MSWIENKIAYLRDDTKVKPGEYHDRNLANNHRTADSIEAIMATDLDDSLKSFLVNLVVKYHFNENDLRTAYHTRNRRRG
jgi:hypothetical protein